MQCHSQFCRIVEFKILLLINYVLNHSEQIPLSAPFSHVFFLCKDKHFFSNITGHLACERYLNMLNLRVRAHCEPCKNSFSWSLQEEISDERMPKDSEGREFLINLIDSPGHVDFSAEVFTAPSPSRLVYFNTLHKISSIA